MKKVFCCVLLLFIFGSEGINAAIVSDNDGSAFVTKAEWDALKNDFNKQIQDYNDSIDGKIEGSIASYLSGLALVKAENVDGFLPSIIKQDIYGAEFHYGGDLGIATQDPFSTSVNICNPNIGIMGIFSQQYTTDNYKVIQYLSHNPLSIGGYSSRWEAPDAGCLLAGFKEVTFSGTKYYGLDDDYNIKKWQMALGLNGMAEQQSHSSSIDTSYASTSWNFLYSMPTCENYTFTVCSVSIGCSKICINKALSSTSYMKSRGGCYYTKSSSTTDVYGWLKDNFYIYNTDTSKAKTETPVTSSWRRHKGVKSGASTVSDNNSTSAYSYKFYMPEKYTVKFDKLINLGATTILGEPVYCYQGLPVVKIEKNYEKAELNIKLTSCGTTSCSKCKVYIADKPFDNEIVTSTSLDASNILYKDADFESIGDRKITVNFPDAEARTLWIKIVPETMATGIAVAVTVDAGAITLYKQT